MEEEKKNSADKGQKAILVILGVIIALGILSAIAFFFFVLGKSEVKKESVAIPSLSALPSETIVSPLPSREIGTSPTTAVSVTPTPLPLLPTPTSSLSLPGSIFRRLFPPESILPLDKTVTLNSTASLDGFRASNLGGNATIDIRVGRNNAIITRGFVSFDLSSLPAAITLKKATLRLYQVKTDGSPYTVGGPMTISHLDYGPSLDSGDYNRVSLVDLGTFCSTPTIEWKETEITDMVKDDIAHGRTNSQYRLKFSTETIGGSPVGDFAYFEPAENYFHSGKTPQLVIIYNES